MVAEHELRRARTKLAQLQPNPLLRERSTGKVVAVQHLEAHPW